MEDLQKALQTFFNHFDAWFDVLNISLTDMKDIDKGNELRVELGTILDSIGSFKAEYDKQVHPSRKQVQDLEKTKKTAFQIQVQLESTKTVGYPHDYWWVSWQDVKELLSGSDQTEEHHFLTVSEAREKLKEDQK